MKTNLVIIKAAVVAVFSIAMAATILFSDSPRYSALALSGGAPSGVTGAPGESTCTSCHDANPGVGQMKITAPATYVPGQTYAIQIQHVTTDTSRLIWGFETIPLSTTNTMAGTVSNINTSTRIRVSGTKNYVTHTATGNFRGQTLGATWTFNWTAPATNIGPVTFYVAGLQGDNTGDETGDEPYNKTAVVQPGTSVVIHHGFTDFDGDGKADASVYRPSNGYWYVNRSTAGFSAMQWGLPTDKLVPADFDGDDKTDVAVWREAPADQAAFYIFQSSDNTFRFELFGQTGDDPTVVGDWDGDGKADPAVFRDSAFGVQSYFFYRGSLNNPNNVISALPWGTTGDRAIRGDFDGDGKLDRVVFRPSTAIWYITQSSNGALRWESWGLPTDKFVPADYDGDGKTDLAVFRNGIWYIKQSSDNQFVVFGWGLNTDMLVPADYDGDGKTDAAVYRNGAWFARLSSSASMSVQNFGLTGDAPIANAFVK